MTSEAVTFGPMVHRFGHVRPDEWDIPFSSFTTLRATDAAGDEHLFEVPTAALPAGPLDPTVRDRLVQRLIRDLTSFVISFKLAPDYEHARALAEGFVLGQSDLAGAYAQILATSAGGHPESTCQRCGGPNPLGWSAPSDVWNAAMGTPTNPRGEGIIVCPGCLAATAYAVEPEPPAAYPGKGTFIGPSDDSHAGGRRWPGGPRW